MFAQNTISAILKLCGVALLAFNPRRQYVVSSRLSQVTPFIAIAQLNFIKESTSYIHNTILGISNTTFTRECTFTIMYRSCFTGYSVTIVTLR